MADLRQLLIDTLVTGLDEDEIRALCSRLHINYDALPGAGVGNKVTEFVFYIERHSLTSELIRIGREQCPGIAWEEILEAYNEQDRVHYPPESGEFGPSTRTVHNNLPQRRPFIGRTDEIAQIRGLLANSQYGVVLIHGIGGIGKSALALETAHMLLEASRKELVNNRSISSTFKEPTHELKVSSGIPPHLYSQLRSVLLDCGPFDSNRDLNAIFVDKRLNPWQNRLPQAINLTTRVEGTINFLYHQHNNARKNALALFLRVLSERLDPGDACHRRLTELASEIERVVQVLDSDRMITKSVIKTHSQDSLTHTFEAFVWVSAKEVQLTLNGLFDVIGRTLDLEFLTKIPQGEKKSRVDKLLRMQKCLLVIDNFETVTDQSIENYLMNLPQGTKALVTSRFQTMSDATVVGLRSLEPRDAISFLRNEAKRLRLKTIENAKDETLDEIISAAGAMPLAMKWAIGQIKQRGQTLDRVIANLKSGKGDVFENLFHHSWNLLTPDSQRILAIMPLFADTATKQAIQYVSEAQMPEVDEALGQLVEMSLVDTDDEFDRFKKRYSVHALTASFALRHLPETGNIELEKRKRAVRYFLSFVHQHNDWGDASGVEAMEAELSNIFKIMNWCRESGDLESYVDFHKSTYNLLWTRGYWHENLTNGRLAVEAAEQIGDREDAAWIHLESLGWIYFEQGDYTQAKAHYIQGENVFKETNNRKGLARAYNYFGRLSAAEKQYEKAAQYLVEGLHYAEDSMSISFLESALGDVRYAQHDYQAAQQHYEKVKEIREQTQDDLRLCSVICDLGDLALVTNDLEKAYNNYLRSLEIAERIRRLSVIARSQRGLAQVARLSGDLSEAGRFAKLASEAFLELGAKREQLRTNQLLEQIQDEINASGVTNTT